MDENLNITVAKIEIGQVNNSKYVLIVHNNETGENAVQFLDDKETAKNSFYFVSNVLRMTNEKIF